MTASRRSRSDSTLATLLKVLLHLGEDAPVYATTSLRSWTDTDRKRWPPGEAGGGLWLVDTRDREGRRAVRRWGQMGLPGRYDAALILSGSGRPGSRLRRLLRRIRRPGTKRLAERRAVEAIRRVPPAHVERLAFEDGPGVPTSFRLEEGDASTGAALLLTSEPPFEGPLWTFIRERTGTTGELLSLHLRERGAAVAILGGRGRHVVRMVADPELQRVVQRNHAALIAIREALEGRTELLQRMPAPLFAERRGSTLVLGETHIPGTLAWKLTPELGDVLHRQSVEFLEALRNATARECSAGLPAELIAEDRARLADASFVDAETRGLLASELERALETLGGLRLALHASHGDFGYGNILADPRTGKLEGVIDWDTARLVDFPGIDRVNLEIQIRGGAPGATFAGTVGDVWRLRAAHDALSGPGGKPRERALFGLAVSRYVLRSFTYPALYHRRAADFQRALRWLSTAPAADPERMENIS